MPTARGRPVRRLIDAYVFPKSPGGLFEVDFTVGIWGGRLLECPELGVDSDIPR